MIPNLILATAPTAKPRRPSPYVAYEAAELQSTEKLVMNAIVVQMRDGAEARFDSIGRLAKLCSLSTRAVQKVKARLVAKGWLKETPRPQQTTLLELGEAFWAADAKMRKPRLVDEPAPEVPAEPAPPPAPEPATGGANEVQGGGERRSPEWREENRDKNNKYIPLSGGRKAAEPRAVHPRGALADVGDALALVARPQDLSRPGAYKRIAGLARAVLRVADSATFFAWADGLVDRGWAGAVDLTKPDAVLGSLRRYAAVQGEQL